MRGDQFSVFELKESGILEAVIDDLIAAARGERARIVFLPGIMGSRLRVPNGSGHDRHPFFWGKMKDFLYWRRRTMAWRKWFLVGNGFDQGGGVTVDGLIFQGERWLNVYDRIVRDTSNDPVFDFMPFPYDWRLSNLTNAHLLRDAIDDKWGRAIDDERKDGLDGRVIIVAHSMGGLVARCMIESDLFEGYRSVRHLITVGTPHLGAPEAYCFLLDEDVPLPFEEAWIDAAMTYEGALVPDLVPKDIQREMLRRFASVYELLPVEPFVHTGTGVPEDVSASYARLPRHTGTGLSASEMIRAFRAHLQTPSRLRDWIAERGLAYSLLGSNKIKTISAVDMTLRKGARCQSTPLGDGTVPISSALFGLRTSDDKVDKVQLQIVQKVKHVRLFMNDAVRNQVKSLEARCVSPVEAGEEGYLENETAIGCQRVPISARPRPGQFYRVKMGDTFFGVSRRAYGKVCGGVVACAQRVNGHPYNRRFWRQASPHERKWFPRDKYPLLPGLPGTFSAKRVPPA